MTTTKIEKFSIIYQPLTVNSSIEVVQINDEDSDGSNAVQIYDVLGGGYYPDYTLFPLVLQPIIEVYDPDGVLGLKLVDVTKDVANMKWYVIEGNEKTLIQNDSPDYEVTVDGTKKGRLKVKRNVQTDFPITLVYEADYLDPRTNDVHPIYMTMLVRAEVAQMPCKLTLDVPSQLFYNPYKKDNNNQPITHQIVHASIFSGSKEANPTMCKCIWMLSSDDGVNFEQFGSSPMNSFAVVADDSLSIDINMEFMGNEITVRCYAIVNDSPSVLAAMTKDSAFAYKQFKITRKLPKYKANILRFPHSVAKSQKFINPKAQIDFISFETDNPEKELAISWETRKMVAGASFKKVGSGLTPEIPVEALTTSTPQQVKMEVKDRGAWGLMADGSGAILTDGQGNYLMIR